MSRLKVNKEIENTVATAATAIRSFLDRSTRASGRTHEIVMGSHKLTLFDFNSKWALRDENGNDVATKGYKTNELENSLRLLLCGGKGGDDDDEDDDDDDEGDEGDEDGEEAEEGAGGSGGDDGADGADGDVIDYMTEYAQKILDETCAKMTGPMNFPLVNYDFPPWRVSTQRTKDKAAAPCTVIFYKSDEQVEEIPACSVLELKNALEKLICTFPNFLNTPQQSPSKRRSPTNSPVAAKSAAADKRPVSDASIDKVDSVSFLLARLDEDIAGVDTEAEEMVEYSKIYDTIEQANIGESKARIAYLVAKHVAANPIDVSSAILERTAPLKTARDELSRAAQAAVNMLDLKKTLDTLLFAPDESKGSSSSSKRSASASVTSIDKHAKKRK